MRSLIGGSILGIAAAMLVGCSADLGPAKDFKLVPLADQAASVSLADFKGKVVLLDFWATWCGPCNKAMPEVQAMWDKYHSKGLEVVAISSEDRALLLGFHKQRPYTYPIYIDTNSQTGIEYGASEIPKFVLIKNGRMLWQSDGGYQVGEIADQVANAIG